MKKLVVGILGGLFGFLLFSCSETEANIAISPVEKSQRSFGEVLARVDGWVAALNEARANKAVKFFTKEGEMIFMDVSTGTETFLFSHKGRKNLKNFLQGEFDKGVGDVHKWDHQLSYAEEGVIRLDSKWSACNFGSGTSTMLWVKESGQWRTMEEISRIASTSPDSSVHTCPTTN